MGRDLNLEPLECESFERAIDQVRCMLPVLTATFQGLHVFLVQCATIYPFQGQT